MAQVKLISEAEATGKVKAVYDDIMTSRKLAKVPPFWKALANNPDYLEAVWNQMKVVMRDGKLDRKTKEMIAVAVSATNNCDYCIRTHTDVLRSLGVDDEALMEMMSVVAMFNGTNSIASGLKLQYEPAVPAE